jgi:hypothetical protein
MTSKRQIAANRRNARRSTGPISHAGKARSQQNALQHGLTVRDDGPDRAAFVASLRAVLAPDATPGSAAFDLAERVADAEYELFRVRRVRSRLVFDACDFMSDAGEASDLDQHLLLIERLERMSAARCRDEDLPYALLPLGRTRRIRLPPFCSRLHFGLRMQL